MAETDVTQPVDATEPEQGVARVDLSPKSKTLEQLAYGPDGKLTYDGMRMVLRSGGSVMWQGRLINRESDLPNEAQLAQGDAVKTERARAALQAQLESLQSQLASLSPVPADAHPALSATMSTSPGNVPMQGVGTGDLAGVQSEEAAQSLRDTYVARAQANSVAPTILDGEPVQNDQSAGSGKADSPKKASSGSSTSSDAGSK